MTVSGFCSSYSQQHLHTADSELISAGLLTVTVQLAASKGGKCPLIPVGWRGWVASLCCFIARANQKIRQGLICSFSLPFLFFWIELPILPSCTGSLFSCAQPYTLVLINRGLRAQLLLPMGPLLTTLSGEQAGSYLLLPFAGWHHAGRGKERNIIGGLSPFYGWQPWQSGPILKETQGIQLHVILMFLNSISLEMK